MDEASRSPPPPALGPRSNPLYGGPPPAATPAAAGGASGAPPSGGGGRTPSWARRTRHPPNGSGSFSDATSTPGESPARDPFGVPPYQYDYPGYTVETPGPSSEGTGSPYRAPPYYVQTPAQSDPGASPFSSAPSSPARFLHHPQQSQGGESDSESQRSSRFGPHRVGRPYTGRLANQDANAAVAMNRIDEDEDEFPDLDRDQQRWVKQYTGATWICIVLLALSLAAAGLVLWFLFRPEDPHYQFLAANVERFDVDLTSVDASGSTSSSLYGNITVVWAVKNPSRRFVLHQRETTLSFSYSELELLQGKVPEFRLGYNNGSANFSASAVGWHTPLYGASPFFLQAFQMTLFLNLSLNVHFPGHYYFLWDDTIKKYDCSIGLNSTTLKVINTTCV
eukprot:TRINITY_DN36276_c0_g1_i1.p1 TRINITY_DN36276_c0_g1~~TRINITY_DN36276_c0_g1_i1.p1  ORF type:complete len:394 (+),score=68.64 TRINITY_DN36276_c0_g1_i1:88-1269(+)